MKIHWSEIAEADLDDIHDYDYIARNVPYYAELFIDSLIEATDQLEEHPAWGAGCRRPETDNRDDVRELIVQGCRIVYLLQTEQLQVLTVIHGSRDLAGSEKKPWEEHQSSAESR